MISRAALAEIVRLTAILPGWCTLQKAVDLAELVVAAKAQTVIEVGLFGGRSFFPMALALRDLGSGRAFGVEAYCNAVAVESPTSPENDEWWTQVDMPAIKRAFLAYLVEAGLEDYAALIELPSDEAFSAFSMPRFKGRVDLIHIDGSHAADQAKRDIQNWSGLLRDSGILVVDDIGWESLQPGRAWLHQTHFVIREVFDGGASYGVYQKNG